MVIFSQSLQLRKRFNKIVFRWLQRLGFGETYPVVENCPDFCPAKLLWPYKASRVPFRLQKALWESYLANWVIETRVLDHWRIMDQEYLLSVSLRNQMRPNTDFWIKKNDLATTKLDSVLLVIIHQDIRFWTIYTSVPGYPPSHCIMHQ